MRLKQHTGFTRHILGLSVAAALAACGGGGGGSSTSSGAGSQPVTTAATAMTGTVAIGTALTGATVTVTDSTGKTATATSGVNGSYSVSLGGLAAPFLITATDPSGVSSPLYSVVASANTSNGAPVTANVTPLTTAVAALMTQSGNPATLAGNASAITSSAIATAETTLNAAIAPILSANNVPASFDPISMTFTPNQTGLDAVIDSIAVNPPVSGTGLQITSLADPNTPVALNSSTSATTTLAAPAQPANYLSALAATLSQCMADVQRGAADTSDAACASAIDANYLNDGFGTGVAGFAKRHTLFAKGTVLTGVKTLAFLPAGTLPAVSNPAALVYFLVTNPSGKPYFASDIVQKLPNGNWDIVGNQDQFDLYIASFVGRLQYVDQANAANSRYESGLRIQIPSMLNVSASLVTADGAVSSTASGGAVAQVGSAVVTGPGLPSGGVGLYMGGSHRLTVQDASTPLLTFPSVASIAPFTCPGGTTPAPCTMSDGTSSEYKWAWSPLSVTGSVSVPASSDYASQSADTSTIRQFGAYTVTLYAVDGSQIGTPQTVLNVAPVQAPQAGQQVAWQTLGTDAIGNFLTPGGSQAGAGVTSLSLDWTESALNPLTPTSIVTGESTQAPGTVAVMGYADYLSPAVTQNGTSYSSTVTLRSATANPLASDAYRLISLLEQVGGDYYINTWRYH